MKKIIVLMMAILALNLIAGCTKQVQQAVPSDDVKISDSVAESITQADQVQNDLDVSQIDNEISNLDSDLANW